MREDEKAAFAELLGQVMGVYRQPVSEFLIGVWWETCKAFELDAVRRAFSAYVRSPDSTAFAPRPSDITKILEGTSSERAAVAWIKVDRAIRTIGHYASMRFDDPLIHRVIEDMGGWVRLASTPTVDELNFVRIEFGKRYTALAARGQAYDPVPYLIGATEQYNAAHGYAIDPPRQLGRAASIPRLGTES